MILKIGGINSDWKEDLLTAKPDENTAVAGRDSLPVRLGGPVLEKFTDPETWIGHLRKLGYRAAYCPVGPEAEDKLVRACETAAKEADITIAEVGAWSNPVNPDEAKRKATLEICRRSLELADRIGARCCVTTAGTRDATSSGSGPHPENLTDGTFDLIVESVRSVIDQVKPARSFFCLETMPYALPDSPDGYLRLLEAVDRKAFAAHLDPVNMISSPQRYYRNADFIRRCFARLGPWLRSCHAKDTLIQKKLTVHIDEVRPGLGELDYRTYLRELSRFPEVPLMLEHLETGEEYALAAEYVRSVAKKL